MLKKKILKIIKIIYSIPLSTISCKISDIFWRHKSLGGKFNSGAPTTSSASSSLRILFKYISGASSEEQVLIGIISRESPNAKRPYALSSSSNLQKITHNETNYCRHNYLSFCCLQVLKFLIAITKFG